MADTDQSNSTAVAPPEPKRERKRKPDPSSTKPGRLPPYNVILLNDDDHTYEYVIEMLGALFGYDRTKAFTMAKEVDTKDRVILLTTTKEHAELKRDQVHAYGADKRMQSSAGSMSAIIEPVPQ